MSQSSGTELKRSKYRLLGLIGQGQFGQVFCAIHRSTGRMVALKNLEHKRFPTHNFLRELRFLLSLQHPNIVTCQALEHTPTGRYLVMDYCEGGTLRSLMQEDYRLSLPCVLKMTTDVLAGLEHAHSREIVHCDIKPENILIQFTKTGWMARISDFGIAQLSQDRLRQGAVGSPAYMAPERFYGQYSESSDLYAVGILLFELLAGYRPFSGTPVELRSAHLNQPLKLTDVIPDSCRAVITTALQKLPGRRFRSATEMRLAIEAIAARQKRSPDRFASRLFVSATTPTRCAFQPLFQEALTRPIGQLAVAALDPERVVLYRAGADWVERQVLSMKTPASPSNSAGSADQLANRELSDCSWRDDAVQLSIEGDSIEQLLIRPGGCLIVTQRSLLRLPLPNAESDVALQPLAAWKRPRQVAVEPEATWFASFSPDESRREEAGSERISPLHLAKLVMDWGQNGQAQRLARPWVASPQPAPLGTIEFADLLALDSRHLALITADPEGSLVQIFTRRGSRVGSLALPIRLRKVAPTLRPYQLLALDDQVGTVLLIDLKPYRINRWWVEFSPSFLAAMDWGYMLAGADGQMAFLDEVGRSLGVLDLPLPITAIAPVQPHGLLVATWQEDRGQLYGLDLQDLGLDLIF